MRCGTTSLYDYLIQNTYVARALKKESQFFNLNYKQGILWYKLFFPTIFKKYFNKYILKKTFITGEATPFIFDKFGPKKVYRYLPNVKIIILLRNPVDRAFSEYNFNVRRGIENFSFEKTLELEFKNISKSFEKIIAGKTYFRYNPHPYLARGLYFIQLKNWFEYFPKQQILIISSEEFFEDPYKILQQVYCFLNLPNNMRCKFRKLNAGEYSKMDNKIRTWLIEFFKPYNKTLYDLLGKNFNWDK